MQNKRTKLFWIIVDSIILGYPYFVDWDHQCGGKVDILAGCGGRGTGKLTSYFARCIESENYKFTTEAVLGSNGTRRFAIRDWNALDNKEALRLQATVW